MADTPVSWGGSLHQTFRLLPAPSPNAQAFLTADGLRQDDVLRRLPYDAARSSTGSGAPDPKRYRDGRHVYQTAGLLYESQEGFVRVTDLGKATARWLGLLSPINSPVLGRHAAYGLAACQLRNPSRAGSSYPSEVEVFPFAFIWRAMLALDNRISSDELNRVIFKTNNEADLFLAIDQIREHREKSTDASLLGEETISGKAKNDRIIPWMSLASFGWLLIADKRESGGQWYEVRPSCRALLREAAQIRRTHHSFSSVGEYVEHISRAAAIPKDVR